MPSNPILHKTWRPCPRALETRFGGVMKRVRIRAYTMPDKLLRLPAVMEMTGLGRSTIYRMMSEGHFPKPLRLGQRAVACSTG